MSTPQWPGQSPGQRNLQRMQQQQREQMQRSRQQAWWLQQQRQRSGPELGDASFAPRDRLGFFARAIRGLLTLLLGIAVLGALVVAAVAAAESETPIVIGAVAAAVVVGLMRRSVKRWGRND